MLKKISFCLLLVGLAGCTDAQVSQWSSIGSPATVKVYSGGKVVATYESTGKVLTERESDGWFFKDKNSGRLVRVSGTVIIEQ